MINTTKRLLVSTTAAICLVGSGGFAGIALAHADGDATQGDFADTTDRPAGDMVSNAALNGFTIPNRDNQITYPSKGMDDDANGVQFQDMPRFQYSPSWGDIAESHDNADIAGGS
jgi:hypothetical protein